MTSNSIAMFGPSPHSVWDRQDGFDAITPLWGGADEEARIAGFQAVDRMIAENAYVRPLIQYVQPIVHAAGVSVTPSVSGALLPQRIAPA